MTNLFCYTFILNFEPYLFRFSITQLPRASRIEEGSWCVEAAQQEPLLQNKSVTSTPPWSSSCACQSLFFTSPGTDLLLSLSGEGLHPVPLHSSTSKSVWKRSSIAWTLSLSRHPAVNSAQCRSSSVRRSLPWCSTRARRPWSASLCRRLQTLPEDRAWETMEAFILSAFIALKTR